LTAGAAPRPPAPVLQPVPAVVNAQERAPWEQNGAGMDTPGAFEETPSAPHADAKNKQAAAAKSRRLVFTVLLVLGFCVIPVCLMTGIGASLFFSSWLNPKEEENQGRRKLEVGKNRKNALPTIQAALRKAEFDTVIELWDDVYEENIVIDPAKGRTNITLQAAPGKEIIWRSASKDPENPIVRLHKATDFKLKGKGIVLSGMIDAERKVNDLMMITSDCSATVIEGLEFIHFARDAVLVMNAAGASDRPLLLRGLRVSTQPSEKPRAGIYLDANPSVNPSKNAHIEIADCTFLGIDAANRIRANPILDVVGENVRWPGK
jgi:hypothetical protein